MLGAIRFIARAHGRRSFLADRFLININEAMNCIIASFFYGADNWNRTCTELPRLEPESSASASSAISAYYVFISKVYYIFGALDCQGLFALFC